MNNWLDDFEGDTANMTVLYFEPQRFVSSKYFWRGRKTKQPSSERLLKASKRLMVVYAHQYAWKHGLHSSKTQFKKRNFRQVKKALEKKLGKKDWDIKPTIPYHNAQAAFMGGIGINPAPAANFTTRF